MHLSLAPKSLCSPGCPWTSDPLPFTSSVLKLQEWTIILSGSKPKFWVFLESTLSTQLLPHPFFELVNLI